MENTSHDGKGLLQNDRLLVCSMLVFYGVCIIGLIGAAFWWLNERSQVISVSATSTAVAVATQQAAMTATVIAHTTEQAQYEFIEHFDDNSGRWFVGKIEKNTYWDGSMQIKDGVYIWKVDEVKKTFAQRIDFFHEFSIKDFDAYLDTKFVDGKFGNVCAGLVFRRSFKGWDQGAYIFSLCNNSTFEIQYHGENGWENISGRQFKKVIQSSDWNRLEISARGNHFIFTINNEEVYELTDDREKGGALEMIIDIRAKNPAMLWFDNLGYQTR